MGKGIVQAVGKGPGGEQHLVDEKYHRVNQGHDCRGDKRLGQQAEDLDKLEEAWKEEKDYFFKVEMLMMTTPSSRLKEKIAELFTE